MVKRVELHPSYTWDCDDCGRENIVRPMPAFLNEEEEQEMREQFGVDSSDEGLFMQVPREVTCKFCEVVFETVPPIPMG